MEVLLNKRFIRILQDMNKGYPRDIKIRRVLQEHKHGVWCVTTDTCIPPSSPHNRGRSEHTGARKATGGRGLLLV